MDEFNAIGDLIFFISKELKKDLDEKLKERGLGQGQTLMLLTLFRLREREDITGELLAKEMGINKANVSRNISKLKEKEIVSITFDEKDQRKKYIKLTDKALEDIKSIEYVLKDIHKKMVKNIEKDILIKTLEGLNKMQKNLSEKEN
ncbi:MAG: MarR family winged helix-turn-helix transcriptional regulator [Clostridium sp.]|uniref:MarR family winged helix-turn-helix transcriptional regulator n=1 Tax=Clostridium TaxID=1485 RepID=UPI00215333AE|nr:MarR family transcriptional regulator [Clostridium sp. LY3-2]MCR6516253.1 MarR family transcriptional regulator [Clostridium sp. LY3-2]